VSTQRNELVGVLLGPRNDVLFLELERAVLGGSDVLECFVDGPLREAEFGVDDFGG
jgi:hypothetical protein